MLWTRRHLPGIAAAIPADAANPRLGSGNAAGRAEKQDPFVAYRVALFRLQRRARLDVRKLWLDWYSHGWWPGVSISDQQRVLSSDWLRFPEAPSPDATARLFCLAHAGGSATAFRQWMATKPGDLEVVAVELPGHGDRIFEPLMTDIGEVAQAIRSAMSPYLDRPYALYGHSMGGAVALALAQLLAADPHIPSPFTLIVGACAPAASYADSSWWLSPDSSDTELVDWMQRVGGTPLDILAEPRLLRLILRIMRSDLALMDDWWINHTVTALQHPIRAMAGRYDVVVPATYMTGWRAETASDFSLTVVEGDHFFYSQATRPLAELIAADLRTELPAR
jgi:surfactin synthase thioesterase subunit